MLELVEIDRGMIPKCFGLFGEPVLSLSELYIIVYRKRNINAEKGHLRPFVDNVFAFPHLRGAEVVWCKIEELPESLKCK